MLFSYPMLPHARRHGPSGYVDYTSYKDWLRDEFGFQCVYCLVRERWSPLGQAAFGIDHLKPTTLPAYHDLVCDYENLVYSCNRCNSIKRDRLLPDPCEVGFGQHMRLHENGLVEGISTQGIDLVLFLRLNEEILRTTRIYYLKLEEYCLEHRDEAEVRWLYEWTFGFPDDLPNLAALRPPANSRPEGLAECYYQQRNEGRLPAAY